MGNKVAVRIKNHHKWGDVANATRHGRREDPAKHVDRERTPANIHWALREDAEGLTRTDEGADLQDCLQRLGQAKGATWRKGASVATEMLWIASPEFFEAAGPSGSEAHAAAARAWATDCLKATAEKFPGMIAAARLDLDEKTPHLAVFLLPQTEKGPQKARKGSVEAEAIKALSDPESATKDALRAAQAIVETAEKKRRRRKPRRTVSVREHFGTREKLRDLQTWAAAAMQTRGHDLERGTPKLSKGQDHLTPAEGRARIAAAKAEAEVIIEMAKTDAAEIVAEAEADAATILEAARAKVRDLTEKLKAVLAACGIIFGAEGEERVRAKARELMKPVPVPPKPEPNPPTDWPSGPGGR